MTFSSRTLRYAALGIVILILAVLGAWYFILSQESASIEQLGEARGFGESIPSFSEGAGSTFENIASGVELATPRAAEESEVPRLWHVSAVPVAGAGFITGANPSLRFVERATGYVFDVNPRTGSIRRLSNTLIPQVQEASVAANGVIALRYLDESGRLSAFSGTPATTTEIGPLSGRELPKNIRALALSPDGKSMFYVLPDGAGAYTGVRALASGENPKKVLTSALSGWHVAWSEGEVRLVQKAADGIVGYAYALSGKNVPESVGSAQGLSVAFDERSNALVYSSAGGGALGLYAKTGGDSGALKLPLATVAEKCVWDPSVRNSVLCAAPSTIPSGKYLDNWYRGTAHTADSWWRVNAETGVAEVLIQPNEPGASSAGQQDVVRPVMDAQGAYLAFMDAKDDSLWLLRIQP